METTKEACSNTNASLEIMAKRLSTIFNSLLPPRGRSVKNGIEFTEMINGTNFNSSEEMGSYDVTALHPSTLIDRFFHDWVKRVATEPYVDMTTVWMKQNVFNRGKWYLQTDDTSIGCSLSNFVAEVFTCAFVESSKCVKKLCDEKLDTIKHGAIRFTIDRQIDGKLPFVNVNLRSWCISETNQYLKIGPHTS